MAQTIKFLQDYGEIEKDLSLREIYNKYFHPNVLPLEDKSIWQHIQQGDILNIFQFDSDVGAQAAKKIKPSTILELTDSNGLMRLMTGEENGENPMDKYIRFKNNIQLWYREMDNAGLSKREQKVLEPYFLSSYGVPPSQEQMMRMLMDENICGFTLKEANSARKVVGKKQMDKIPELKKSVLEKATSEKLGQYVWKNGIGPQMGYSFSVIHALAYSFIGFQTAYIASRWNPIYWDTACLIVNSGSLENDNENDNENDYIEDEDGQVVDIKKKEASTDYTKLAKALGEIISQNIKISLIDINNSDYGFKPDIENNQILFGLKALSNVGAPIIDKIMSGRPYHNVKDFIIRCPINKTAMISLIKAGAFDNLCQEWATELKIEPRILAMIYYLSIVSEPKSKLNLQNFNGLMQRHLIPDDFILQQKIFEFNKILKLNKKGSYYIFASNQPLYTQKLIAFYNNYFDQNNLEIIQGMTCIQQKIWDKIYQNEMNIIRDWLKNNQEEILKQFNTVLFQEAWNKYAQGNVSAWEMEALCFYYHDHELKTINNKKYGTVNFKDLPSEPVDYFFKRNGKQIPIYTLSRIAGTVIGKNDARHSVSLLTTSGVVNVKFTKEYFALFGRQISEIQEDGTKKVKEKGWFTRGTKLLVQGYRRDDTFVSKSYKNSGGHQLYKITKVNGTDLELSYERYNQEQ